MNLLFIGIFIVLTSVCLLVESNNPNVKVTPETVSISLHPLPDVGSKLTKKAFSNRTRLLFVAGLEGTGHHAMLDMFTVCNQTGKCEPDNPLSQALMKFDGKLNEMYGLFGTAGSNDVMDNVANVENRLRELIAEPGEHLYFVGLRFFQGSGTGMMSYPNFEGRDKSLDYPDAFSLAMIAESVGIDFRILVLQRSAKDIITSTQKRGFGGVLGVAGEPKILMASAQALFTQLFMLDRKFFECVRYSDLNKLSSQRVSQLVDFLHPINMKDDFESMLRMVRNDSTSSTTSHRHLESFDPRNLNTPVKISDTVKKPSRFHFSPHHDSKVNSKNSVNPLSTQYHVMHLAHRLALIDELCDS